MRRALLLLALAACSAPEVDTTPQPDAGHTDPPALPTVEYPNRLVDENPDPHIVEVHLEAGVTEAELVPGKTTKVWAYNGMIPGPLLQVRAGDRVIVHFKNSLPEDTTIHWHGLRISDAMDGSQMMNDTIKPGGEFTYDFTPKDPGSYWYHPHVRPSEETERGLYGAIVVHEPAAEVPDFDADRYFVLDDVRLNDDGSIAPITDQADTMSGRFGNALLVNGSTSVAKIAFKRNHVERWRFVNSANARTFKIRVEGATWRIAGTDGGLLPEVVDAPLKLTLPVGQRYDMEVRLTSDTAKVVAFVDTDDGTGHVKTVAMSLVEGTADGVAEADPTRPVTYPAITLPDVSTAAATQTLHLSGFNQNGQLHYTINGKAWPDGFEFDAKQNVVTKLVLVNDTMMEHPFHLHGNFFQILQRSGARAEKGLKDTVLVGGMETVTIATAFENPGHWMFHCHILEHSESGMMGMVMVEPSATPMP